MTAEAPLTPPWSTRAAGWARRNWLGLTVFGSAWLVLALWWAAYYPGLFSPDSLGYIWQSTTSHWDNHHSVLYDALLWLCLYGTGGVATLTFLQTVAVAAGLGYSATALRRVGAPAWLLLPLGVGVTMLPTIGTFVVCVWKDVGYTIPMLFAFGTLVRVVELRLRARPVARRLLVLLGVELLAMCLMRPNGFVAVGVTTVLAVLVFRGIRRELFAVGAAAVIISLAANFVIFPLLGVRNVIPAAASETTYGDIAVLYAEHPEAFTAADRALLASAAPLDSWRIGGYCGSIDALIGAPGFSTATANLREGEFTALWLRLVRTEPGAVTAARLCRAAVIWKPWATGPNDWLSGPPITGYQHYVTPQFLQSPYAGAVYFRPLSDRLHRYSIRVEKAFAGPVLQSLAWRGSLWSYLTYLALLIGWLRRRRLALLGVGVLTAANQLALLPQTPGPGARYMFPAILIGALAVTVAVSQDIDQPEVEPQPDPDREPERGETGPAESVDPSPERGDPVPVA